VGALRRVNANAILCEIDRLDALAAGHQEDIRQHREVSGKAEIARREAEKAHQLKEDENAKLRRQLEEMEARLKDEAKAREEEDRRVSEERKKKEAKSLELQQKHDAARAREAELRQAQSDEEVCSLHNFCRVPLRRSSHRSGYLHLRL
jgi:hypothetical protein